MSNQDSPSADNKLPWSLRKHRGSVACYSDVVNAAGHPICCVHDDYAALIVNAVNNGEHLTRELAQIKRELEQSRASCLLMKNAAQELNRELAQAKERIDLLNRGQREMVLALAQLRGQLSARDDVDAERAAQASIESQAQAETKGDPPYMPSHHELFSAVNHYAREILRLTDAVPADCQSHTASPQSEPSP